MNFKELCLRLTDISATAGDEAALSDVLAGYLKEYVDCSVGPTGNLYGSSANGKYHIMLDAHIDQIGLVVRGIDDKGFLLIDKIGSADIRVLTGSEVVVHGKQELFGVICSVPPHLQSGDDSGELNLKSMAVDIGLNLDDAKELVSIGDRITMRGSFDCLLNNCICAPALDNRAGVVAILGALELVKNRLKNVKLSVLFSVQEEVGCRGAGCGAFSLQPDCAIVVDVGFGDDSYTDRALTLKLGDGPSIGLGPVLNKKISDELKAVAQSKSLPVQNDVMCRNTGTNADTISVSGYGVPTALLSIPLRYMHTANEVINIDDLKNTSRLIAEFILKKEAEFDA